MYCFTRKVNCLCLKTSVLRVKHYINDPLAKNYKLRLKCGNVSRVKQMVLRVKALILRVKHLTLRVKQLVLRVKQCIKI